MSQRAMKTEIARAPAALLRGFVTQGSVKGKKSSAWLRLKKRLEAQSIRKTLGIQIQVRIKFQRHKPCDLLNSMGIAQNPGQSSPEDSCSDQPQSVSTTHAGMYASTWWAHARN